MQRHPTIHSIVRLLDCRLRADHLLARIMAVMISFCTCMVSACPFCSSLPHTISDDLEESIAAVIASPEFLHATTDGTLMYRMRITKVIKGHHTLEESYIELSPSQEIASDRSFWLVGYGEDDNEIGWATPREISPDGVTYLAGLKNLPEQGPRRLEYFLRFLQHEDEFIASDAYNEFAEASMQDIVSLKDKLDRKFILSQLRNPSLPIHQRRLCWTLLSQCGTPVDMRMFNESLKQRQLDPTYRPGMDAAISCFISLGGERALSRIDRDYLSNPEADTSDCFAAISAIRVHGTELKQIPRHRLAKSLHYLLDRPDMADMVIPDLARWEDWSAIDKVVDLFQQATEQTVLLKPTSVLYLKNCPLPAAKAALETLRKVDPTAVAAAETSMLFNSGRAAVPVPQPESRDNHEHIRSARKKRSPF